MASVGQAHVCRLRGEHMPGLECLSDPQILHILYAMDLETLLSCGRANQRLNRLVCDKQVWKNLLKGIDYFGDFKAVVRYVDNDKEDYKSEADKRMEELVKFVVYEGKVGRRQTEMGAELVKEVASRFKIYSTFKILSYISTKNGPRCKRPCSFKVTVIIQGWDGVPETFEMSEGHLHQLHDIAQTVGAKFTIKEVMTVAHLVPGRWVSGGTFRLIEELVGQQEEGLDKLELHSFKNGDQQSFNWHGSLREHQEIFFSLVRASKEWKVDKVILNPMRQNGEFFWPEDFNWAALARSAGTGHIGTVQFPIYKAKIKRVKKEDVRAVREIAERFSSVIEERIEIGGGRAREEDPKTTWEEAYENQLKKIFSN